MRILDNKLDITEPQSLKLGIDERLDFERVLAELSATFVNLVDEEIDGYITDGLRRLGEFMEVDRAFVLQLREGRGTLRATHFWYADGIETDEFIRNTHIEEQFAWVTEKTKNGQTILINRLAELPAEAANERKYCQKIGIQSFVMAPITVGGTVLGMIGFDTQRMERAWSDELIYRLRLVGDIFASALTRKRNQRTIEQLRRFEGLIADISSTFINLRHERVEQVIEDGLRLVGECLDLDIGYMLQYEEGGEVFRVAQQWFGSYANDNANFRGVSLNEDFPWLAKQLAKKEPVLISQLDEFPPEAAKERTTCEQIGIQSVLWVPLFAAAKLNGYIVQCSTRRQIIWSDEIIQRMRIIGETFANALRRKRFEQVLQDSEERFRTMFEQAPTAVAILDDTGSLVSVNQGMCNMLGYTQEELMGLTFRDITHPDDVDVSVQVWQDLWKGTLRTLSLEKRYLRKDREVVWGRLMVTTLRGEWDQSQYGLAVIMDITERKLAQEQLQENETRLRHLLETTNAIPWVADAKTWQFTYVGPQAVELLGYPIDQWYEKDFWASHIHPEDCETAINLCMDYSYRLKDYEFEYRMIAAGGKIVWLHDIVNVTFVDGVPETLRGFLIDITERKQVEKEIQDRLLFEQLISSVSAKFVNLPVTKVDTAIKKELRRIGGFFDVDRVFLGEFLEQGKIIVPNHVWSMDARKMYITTNTYWNLYNNQNLIPRLLAGEPIVFADPAEIPDIQSGVTQAAVIVPLSVGGAFLGIIALELHKRKRDWPSSVVPRLRMIGEVLANALSRKRGEEALRKSEITLRRRQKDLRHLAGRLLTSQEEERRRLARELHDDLTQRMAVLAIEAGKLDQNLPSAKDPRHNMLTGITDKLVELSADIHDLSRQLHPSILDDLGLVDALRSECKAFSKREGIFVLYHADDVTDNPPRDTALCLYRIAQESLRNISRHAHTKRVNVSLSSTPKGIRLQVSDFGAGFDTKRVIKKSGLGLQSMKERVHLINGKLSIQSQPGKGTTVDVWVPIMENKRQNTSSHRQEASTVSE